MLGSRYFLRCVVARGISSLQRSESRASLLGGDVGGFADAGQRRLYTRSVA